MRHSKLAMGLAALSLTVVATESSQAAFTSRGVVPFSMTSTLTGTGSVQMTAVAKNRSDNSNATALNFSNVTAGSGWKLADQYIQLNTNITASGAGGVQIYTDNMAADANPKFTGNVQAQTPAGLVAVGDTTKKLPTAWRIVSDLTTVTGPAVPVGSVSNPDGYAWLYHKDKSQVAIGTDVTPWQDGEDFVTVYKAGAGIHFGQASNEFGGFKTVDQNYIYTEADFTAATTPNTYSTNKLILEAYTL